MTTLWIARLYFFVRAADMTATNRDSICNCFVNNGGLETLANERGITSKVMQLSTTGNTPATAYAVNSAVKLAMRDPLKTVIGALTQSAWYVVANTPDVGQGWDELELIQTDSGLAVIGTAPFTFAMALADVNARRAQASLAALRVISASQG